MKNFPYLFLSFFLLLYLPVHSQSSKNLTPLRFTDSLNNVPITTVIVEIANSKDTALVKGYVNEFGVFNALLIPHEKYILKASAIGYNPLSIPISIVDYNTKLDDIILSKDPNTLKEVAISGYRPIVTPTIEGLQYDVSADPENNTMNLLETISKVPLLSVDVNDDVLMKGSADFKFYVNGIPSSSLESNAKDVLKSMPSNTIKHIEVITHPSSRYDAEGVGGIINIVTKKSLADGYHGSVQLEYYFPYGPSANFSTTVKAGKFTISENMGYSSQNKGKLKKGNFRHSLKDKTSISQDGVNSQKAYFGYSNTDLSFEIDTLNLLTASIVFYGMPTTIEGFQTTIIRDESDIVLRSYEQSRYNKERFNTRDITLNYQLGFKDNEDATVTTSYKNMHGKNVQSNSVNFEHHFNYDASNFIQNNDVGIDEQTGQIDFVYPLKKWSFEMGVKGIFRDYYSDYNNLISKDKNVVPDESASNKFEYQQDVYSIYNSYDFELFKWKIKAGARLEKTTVNADFSTMNTAFQKSYNNLIPSLILQKEMLNSQNINISYNQRIERPSIWQLNPFIDESNQLFVYTGNKNLEAVLTHNIGLTYSNFNKSSFSTGLFYNFTNNGIQDITRMSDSLSIMRPENIAKRRELGNTSHYGLNKKKLRLNINSQVTYIRINGLSDNQLQETSGFQGNIYAYVGYRFDNGFSTSLNIGYTSRSLYLQGESNGYSMTGFSVRKTILDEEGSISLSVNNPFRKFRTYKTKVNGESFYQTSYSNSYFRGISVSFSYNFGKLKDDVKRSDRGISNDDVRGK